MINLEKIKSDSYFHHWWSVMGGGVIGFFFRVSDMSTPWYPVGVTVIGILALAYFKSHMHVIAIKKEIR